ncbi:hypothetical protein Lal_00002393, partial [Lupinus albus]
MIVPCFKLLKLCVVLYDLQNKEQLLVETNRGLTLNVEEINLRNQYRQWDEGEQSNIYLFPKWAQDEGNDFLAYEHNGNGFIPLPLGTMATVFLPLGTMA